MRVSATTYASGTLSMPWKRRLLAADGVAVLLWGLFSSALGYLGGETFEHNLWLPLLICGRRRSVGRRRR